MIVLNLLRQVDLKTTNLYNLWTLQKQYPRALAEQAS